MIQNKARKAIFIISILIVVGYTAYMMHLTWNEWGTRLLFGMMATCAVMFGIIQGLLIIKK